MRFGWLAAAAALMCAGQAGAQRYQAFQIVGQGILSKNVPMSLEITSSLYTDTVTAYFDTASATGDISSGVGLPFYLTNRFGVLQTFSLSPVGPYFGITFDQAAIATGTIFQDISVLSGGFGYNVCNHSCGSIPGTILSFKGYKTDIAPAALGLSDVQTITALPEPASWLAFVFGFAAIGWIIRRRDGSDGKWQLARP